MGFQLPTSTGELTTRISAIKPVSPLFRGGIRGGLDDVIHKNIQQLDSFPTNNIGMSEEKLGLCQMR